MIIYGEVQLRKRRMFSEYTEKEYKICINHRQSMLIVNLVGKNRRIDNV